MKASFRIDSMNWINHKNLFHLIQKETKALLLFDIL